MATIQSNRLSVTIPPEQLTSVKNSITGIGAQLDFLIGLTPDERQTMPKINDSNKTFVDDALNVGTNNAFLLPGYFDVDEVVKDYKLFLQTDELALLLRQLLEKVEDTAMLAGSEAYISALTIY